jgi:hypothetical protein
MSHTQDSPPYLRSFWEAEFLVPAHNRLRLGKHTITIKSHAYPQAHRILVSNSFSPQFVAFQKALAVYYGDI